MFIYIVFRLVRFRYVYFSSVFCLAYCSLASCKEIRPIVKDENIALIEKNNASEKTSIESDLKIRLLKEEIKNLEDSIISKDITIINIREDLRKKSEDYDELLKNYNDLTLKST